MELTQGVLPLSPFSPEEEEMLIDGLTDDSKVFHPGNLEIRAGRKASRKEEESPLPGAPSPTDIRMPPSKYAKVGQNRWDSDNALRSFKLHRLVLIMLSLLSPINSGMSLIWRDIRHCETRPIARSSATTTIHVFHTAGMGIHLSRRSRPVLCRAS